MTSEDRHKNRYVRRVIKRNEKKKSFLEKHGRFELCANRNATGKSAMEAAKGSSHKESTKAYILNRLRLDAEISDSLIEEKDIRKGFVCFDTIERGHLRKIMSVRFRERVPQKSLNQNILIPCMMRSNIYDNGASQKGKGCDFFHSELTKHLIRHYKKYGTEGYALITDFLDFFGSADHGALKKNIFDAMKIIDGEENRWKWFDGKTARLTFRFIDAYKIHNIKKKHMSEKDAARGLGLGSEINQTLMVTLPNKLDHFIKEVLGIKCYSRYMDDSALIHHSLSYLKICLEKIKEKCKSLGISINEKKTRFVKLTRGFTICKVKYGYTKTGGIVKRPIRKKFSSERRKLKKQCEMLAKGNLSFESILASYRAWRGSLIRNRKKRRNVPRKTYHNTSLNCHRSLRLMDNLFNKLFILRDAA